MALQDDQPRSGEDADSGEGATTLGQLCASLGPDLMEIVLAPKGVDVAVENVSLHDPLDPPPREPGSGRLILAVGAEPEPAALEPLLRSAPPSGIVGVACRNLSSASRQLLAVAEETGIALLSVPEDVAWGELYEVLRAVIAVDELGRDEQADAAERVGLHDLFAIAEATAAIAGGPVTIDDMQSRILAFSGGDEIDHGRRETILNRKVPEYALREMRERGMIEHLLTSDEVLHVDFEGPDLQPRRAIAIRLGASVLGSIWLAGDDETLSPDADDALRRAAPIAALHMVRQRVSVNVERRMRESRVAALLRGDEAPAGVLEEIGLPADAPLVVMAVETTARRASSPAAVGPRLIDLLTMDLHAYERDAVATSLNGPVTGPRERVYVLTSCRDQSDRETLRRIASECNRHAAKRLGVQVRVGIGHAVPSLQDLALARRSAEDCLALTGEGEDVVAFEEIYDRALLVDVERFVEDWHAGPSPGFAALVEHDAARGTDYVNTLRCVLDCFGNAAEAAKRLHLHVNTVRYRLRRIAEITGVDLGDGDARLALELELRARTHQP